MDCEKTGRLIRALRTERGLTQLKLAETIGVSDKAVSKWERGLGLPDVGLLGEVAAALGVSVDALLGGELIDSGPERGNMKNTKYYVCPVCGSVSLCTGAQEVSCCGRRLAALEAVKAEESDRLNVEKVEDDWFITSDHPMTKDDYISFVAFARSEAVEVSRAYPEWALSVRIPMRGHGRLLWYSAAQGLKYQLI